MILLEQALRAQKALREAAGLSEEVFPLSAFVGMISDEIEALRKAGYDDFEIVSTIQNSSGIILTVKELQENYAESADRHSDL